MSLPFFALKMSVRRLNDGTVSYEGPAECVRRTRTGGATAFVDMRRAEVYAAASWSRPRALAFLFSLEKQGTRDLVVRPGTQTATEHSWRNKIQALRVA